MKWAIKNQQRISATPNDRASCPLCTKEMIAKCGSVKIWHWAHKSNRECDKWYEPETEWHLNWKNEFLKEQQEVIIKKGEKYHIADIKTRSGNIIELQNSPISLKEIKERENFYGEKLIWLLNEKTFAKNLHLKKKYFIWKWTPKIISSNRMIFIDYGYKLIKIINLWWWKKKRSGEYESYSKKQFLEIYGDIFKEGENDLQG